MWCKNKKKREEFPLKVARKDVDKNIYHIEQKSQRLDPKENLDIIYKTNLQTKIIVELDGGIQNPNEENKIYWFKKLVSAFDNISLESNEENLESNYRKT